MPVRLHWTLPVGMFLFGGMAVVPVFWSAFFVILLVHELGHAIVARRYGHRVTAIEVTGFGGVCRWEGNASDDEIGAIAWGGVAAQSILAAATYLVLTWTGKPEVSWGIQLVRALIYVNIALIVINLIPLRPLDGADAWPWVGRIIQRWRGQAAIRNHVDVDAMLCVVEAPPIEPPRPPSSSRPRIPNVPLTAATAREPRQARCSSDEELAELLKAIADEAAEEHRRNTRRSA